MKSYDTLTEALQDLKTRGYTIDFNLHSDGAKFQAGDLQLHPEDFDIREVYRFEGMSDPDDNAVVYAIESKKGDKGVLVDAYGTYASALSPEMAQRIRRQ